MKMETAAIQRHSIFILWPWNIRGYLDVLNPYWIQIKFPMQKLAIFRKVKKIKELHGGVQVVRRTSNSTD